MSSEHFITETLRSLERQRDAESTLVAIHTARLTDITETIVAFTEELQRFAGHTAIEEPYLQS